jgi:predicted RecA/RadA family phage recombinase
MARNFVMPGSTITIIAPQGGVLSGAPVLVGSIFGIAAYDAVAGAEVEVTVDGVWELAKAAGALDPGDPIYFDPATGLVGDAGPGAVLIGAAVAAAGADDLVARVRLDGVSVPAAVPPG